MNSYIQDFFRPERRKTIQVKVGNMVIGGGAPILVQSMTTTKPKDIEETVHQTLALEKAGCKLVRITVPTLADALALEPVVKKIRESGGTIPLSADIHFQPKAAFEALKWVEKVRINPGNFVDSGILTLENQTENSFAEGQKKVREQFGIFLQEAKKYNRAIRIGVNHGSLSARMLYKYGDTVKGMVESALEYLQVCEEENFDQVVVSLKASNPRVAIEAYRELVFELNERNMKPYPLHVGVTEAGAGADGRLKSAVGIGSLLADGLGDTIRVSLTEDPVKEIEVAEKLIQVTKPCALEKNISVPLWNKNSYEYKRLCSLEKQIAEVKVGNNLPVRIGTKSFIQSGVRSSEFIFKDLPKDDLLLLQDACDLYAFLAGNISYNDKIICYAGANPIVSVRAIVSKLLSENKKNPIALYFGKPKDESEKLKTASEMGSLLSDGIGDLLYVDSAEKEALDFAYDILQAAGVRRSKTEFISCPGCGRTLYDIRSVIGTIKEKLGHLQDVSIAVMGCIVNGPGEMSGADFGYVGGAPGRISLYEGLKPVKKNIPEAEALDELIALLKDRNRWVEPK